MAKPQDRFKSRKKTYGEHDDSVWKRDSHWERERDTGPGTGWVKDGNIPKANAEPYKSRPGLDSYEAAYRKATRKRKKQSG